MKGRSKRQKEMERWKEGTKRGRKQEKEEGRERMTKTPQFYM